MTEIIDCYPYSRVSTTRQLSGMGMELQNENLQKALAAHPNWRVKASFRDLGISSFRGENRLEGELGQFIELVKDGKVRRGSVLIVYSLDRVSRDNIIDAQGLLFDLLRADIVICTTIDGMIFDRHDDQQAVLMNLIRSLFVMVRANEELETKSKRANDLLALKRSQPVLPSGKFPVLTKTRPAWLDIVDGEFVENAGAQTVKRIFREAASGLGSYVIMSALNNEHVPTLTGNKKHALTLKDGTPNLHPRAGQSKANGWNPQRVIEIIRSDAPLGFLQLYRGRGKDKVPDGPPRKCYPEIVSQLIANKARAAISSRAYGGAGAGRRGPVVSNLFSGVAICGSCGGSMILANRLGSRGQSGWLRCTASVKDINRCRNRTGIPYGKLEEAVIRDFSIVRRIIRDSSVADDNAQEIEQALAEKRAEADRKKTAIINMRVAFGDPSKAAKFPIIMDTMRSMELEQQALIADVEILEKQLRTEKQTHRNVDDLVVGYVVEKMRSADADVVRKARAEMAMAIRTLFKTITCGADRKVRFYKGPVNDGALTFSILCDQNFEVDVWLGADLDDRFYEARFSSLADFRNTLTRTRSADGKTVYVRMIATDPVWLATVNSMRQSKSVV